MSSAEALGSIARFWEAARSSVLREIAVCGNDGERDFIVGRRTSSSDCFLLSIEGNCRIISDTKNQENYTGTRVGRKIGVKLTLLPERSAHPANSRG